MPAGKKSSHAGQIAYGELQKAYSSNYKKLSKVEKAKFGGYNNWKKHDRGGKLILNASRYRANTASGSNDDNAEAGPSNAPDSADSPAEDWDPALFDTAFLDSPAMADIQNNMPNAGTGSQVAQSGGAGGATLDQGVERTGGGSGAAGASSTPGITSLPPIISSKKMHFSFQKRWYKYTYGLAHTPVDGVRVQRLCTPYAYYPVDWLPFYLSPQEYKNLPMGSKCVSVSCDISIIGTRTSFDHGTSLTGTATTEYVPILKHVTGLNNKLYIENRSFKLKSTEPMMVETLNNKTLDEYFAALYGPPPSALEIPRHLNWYACYLYNKTTNEYSGLNEVINYRVDKVLNTAMVNKVMQGPIVSYTYQPSNGYVKPGKKNMLIQYNAADGFADDVTNKQIIYKHTLPTLLKIGVPSGQADNIRVQKNTATPSFNYLSQVSTNYYQSVEGYTFINPHSGQSGNFRNQPQVHIGLLATPALNPGSENTNFLNSSIYTVTNASCTIEFDIESMCIGGDTFEWPDDVKFFIESARGFTGYGYHNFGIAATTEPRLTDVLRKGSGSGIDITCNSSSANTSSRSTPVRDGHTDKIRTRVLRSPGGRGPGTRRSDRLSAAGYKRNRSVESDSSVRRRLAEALIDSAGDSDENTSRRPRNL